MEDQSSNKSEEGIIESLSDYYYKRVKYCINNIYLFKSNWESDFFILRKNGYCAEYEIKISRSDFKADFKKKQKHEILKVGKYVQVRQKFLGFDLNRKAQYKSVREIKTHNFRPNKFYYVVPVDLISSKEVPEYAGLIYCKEDGQIRVIKEAPFIHKEKLGYALIEKLCHKFYYRIKN